MSDAPPPGWGQPPGPPPGQGQPAYPPTGQPPGYGPPGYDPPGYGPPGYDPYGQPPPKKGRAGLIVAVVVLALLAVGLGGAMLFLLAAGDGDDPVSVASEISTTLSEMASPRPTEVTEPPTPRPFDTPTEEEDAPPTGEAVDQSVFELEVGTCFDDPQTAEEIESVGAVPCEAAHDNEVFALIEHPADGDEPYPGRESLTTFAEEECRGEAFADYVGIEYQFSRFFVSQLTPTDGSWEQGDREIVCLLFDPAEETVGSVQGSGE